MAGDVAGDLRRPGLRSIAAAQIDPQRGEVVTVTARAGSGEVATGDTGRRLGPAGSFPGSGRTSGHNLTAADPPWDDRGGPGAGDKADTMRRRTDMIGPPGEVRADLGRAGDGASRTP